MTGPVAPSIERPDDEWAWHTFSPLSPDAMRRRRRIDIRRSDEPDLVEVGAHFRDSHMGEDGYETIIHEYIISAMVDTTTMTFLDAPRPLLTCSRGGNALRRRPSAHRLAGRPLAMLRPAVRAEFLGPTTCTHLNDTLRGLKDVSLSHRSVALTSPATRIEPSKSKTALPSYRGAY